jgi:hypothetical protein
VALELLMMTPDSGEDYPKVKFLTFTGDTVLFTLQSTFLPNVILTLSFTLSDRNTHGKNTYFELWPLTTEAIE